MPPAPSMIDLRSDTQTKPSPAMREAMAGAEVGDEQKREDPTVVALEEAAAAFVGQRGGRLPAERDDGQRDRARDPRRARHRAARRGRRAHIMISELGGPAMHAGLLDARAPRDARPDRARAGPRARSSRPIRCTRRSRRCSRSRTPHNSSGGTVWPLRASSRRSSRRRASSAWRSISTARGSRTPRSRSAARRLRSGASSTPSRCASRRVSAARSARSSPARTS